MRLLFDCRFIRFDHHDGISRFSSELFSALAGKGPLVALIHDERQLQFLPSGTDYILGNDPTHFWAELGLPQKLNKNGVTHVFSPMQTMGSLGKRYKLVLTLHDLIYYSHPQAPAFLPLHVRIAWRLYHMNFFAVRVLLNRADAVATVSHTSRDLIVRNRLTKRPVHVIYNAAKAKSRSSPPIDSGKAVSRNKLVYMGSFMEYKNVECLVAAMNSLPEFELVLLSKISDRRRTQFEALAGDAVDRVIFKNGVSDHEYSSELSGAFALITASKEEGFGIPLVEAMQQGIPLVVSDIPIFREVAENAALYFDPSDQVQFVNQIRELEDAKRWQVASAASKNRADFFDWASSAESLLAVLRRL